jgi:hypothetical protein
MSLKSDGLTDMGQGPDFLAGLLLVPTRLFTPEGEAQ